MHRQQVGLAEKIIVSPEPSCACRVGVRRGRFHGQIWQEFHSGVVIIRLADR